MTLTEMAASYRHSAELIRGRVAALRNEARQTRDPERQRVLEQRVRELSVLYRETRETAQHLERYYRGRCHDGERRA